MSVERTLPKYWTPEEWRWYVISIAHAAAKELRAKRIEPSDDTVKHKILERRQSLADWQRFLREAHRLRRAEEKEMPRYMILEKYRKLDENEHMNCSFLDETLQQCLISSDVNIRDLLLDL